MVATLEPDVEQTPDYWMIVWLRAIQKPDLESAAEAQRQLRDLGINVRLTHSLVRQTQSEVQQS